MTDSESCTPRIVFYNYPKVTHSIRNITNEIDNRLKDIKKKNETLDHLCPIPKNPNTRFSDKHVLHLLINGRKLKNCRRQTHNASTVNKSQISIHFTDTFEPLSNSKKPILFLQRNRTSLFRRKNSDSFFKNIMPTAFTEDNQTTPSNNNLKKRTLPFIEQHITKAFKIPRPNSSINFNHQNLIDLCDKTIKKSSKLHQSIVNQDRVKSKIYQKKYHSHSKEHKFGQPYEEIPFEKVSEKYYIYHLGHFISKNQGIKDNLINFQNIEKICPNECHNMRNILGEEIIHVVDTKEDKIKLIHKEKNKKQYQKPKWINISDKKSRQRFNEILKKSETNKRELARVIERYQLTSPN